MNYSQPYNHRQAGEILNSPTKLETFNQIKTVISELPLKPFEKGGHQKIKKAFKDRGWSTEERISARNLQKRWRYDAFKNRVAVEIDTGTPCYRSFLKFILGYNEDKIDVGVILVYDERHITPKTRHRRFTTTKKELKDLFSIVPVPILLVGIY